MTLSFASERAVDKAVSWLSLPPGNDTDAPAVVVDEWAQLVGTVTAVAAVLDQAHPAAAHLRTAAVKAGAALDRWRAGTAIDDVEHAELVRDMELAAAQIKQGEAFDEDAWRRKQWWERAHEFAVRWSKNAPATDFYGCQVVLQLTIAALESTDPAAVHDVLVPHLPGQHIHTILVHDDDPLDLDVGYVALEGWLGERLTHPDAVRALADAFETYEDPTAPQVPARIWLRDGLPSAVAVLREHDSK